ncbi:bifunctional 2-C-methyl-D-erythritol 4-phosphate cytidylyltransferase/2-C-methyl-D-erythritol 2,4-cyclodiphosphate synthase [Vineibacter terrae]|uniref:bifunctional 2-C-methyl-D-erythritol 4-phosphate cytidylyltransferase/2-C-methyl-D-erythritol 2,4-cyclodiphosphate synthase n=1 Tax=Vineibacter terrae TaxID=2586908 RepID=UPI002E336897|nr:bifunctional 2-C-methyl-D-erythritol 4-phosphate cytidylyltransferase/2-C-methyl-D-erythritol 2,4-cyclodiphosphate synthase [Vineibacter terrae]HEX2884806.1 bifunctional 2-C-methyl-D-erythritol 4-phosphate cytidylyltransferase/2-C-methyl-D-erythritol 2,4-cyclodiphosphate synthase [Vineibacter terrae]
MPRTVALIVAAGRGHRLGGPLPKQYQAIGARSVLRQTLEQFSGHPAVEAVQVVIAASDRVLYDAQTAGLVLRRACIGGATRQRSVLNGLEALTDEPPEIVTIHDAARPLVSADVISRTIEAVATSGIAGAVAGVPVADTLKRVEGGRVAATVDRQGLWRAQTPQSFRFAPLLAAHRAVAALGDSEETALTDDVAVAERAGLEIAMVEGEERNFKITTEDDLARARRELALRRETRMGTGFDVHAFGPGTAVTLCGVEIPHTQGLVGHSDADVALHALTDALLGAVAAGDIGQYFPPSDPQWRGAASERFLRHAAEMVERQGGRIVNVDVTLICEAPRVGPHRDRMRARVAEILGIAAGRVGIKATTTEKLGFTGRGEGIAVQAAATVEVPVED